MITILPIMKNNEINSPFRYAGGKFYARKLIIEHIPYHFTYIEPFAGGASIFFAKDKVELNHLNDIDEELINVLNIIKNHPEELISFFKVRETDKNRFPKELFTRQIIGEPIPALKELHYFFKNIYQPQNDIERAGRWFYLNRTSYSGIMNLQNMYWGYGDKYSMQPKNWPRNIRRSSEKLQNVLITSLDFEQVIDNAPDNSLLFVDPPYFKADQDKFYNHAFSEDDHFRLEKTLRRNTDRLKIFITYDNVPEVRELYSWMQEIHDKEWNYCIQRTDDQKTRTRRKGQRYKGKEIFILNYDSTEIRKKEEQLEIDFNYV